MFLLNKHIKEETHFGGRDVSAFSAHFDKPKVREASQELVKNNNGLSTPQFLLPTPSFCIIFLNSQSNYTKLCPWSLWLAEHRTIKVVKDVTLISS